jgi:hypothetical protein
MQRISLVLHGTLGSYLCDAVQEGGEVAVACLRASRGLKLLCFPLFLHVFHCFLCNKCKN